MRPPTLEEYRFWAKVWETALRKVQEFSEDE